MQYTENYSLRKPQMAETASVSDINYNADRIDAILADDRQISVAMYVSGNTYNTGDLVGHESASGHIQVFKCNTDGTTGTWNSAKWDLTNLADEIKLAAASGGDNANQNIADEYDPTESYVADDYVIYNSLLYKCIGVTTGAWDSTKWASCVVTDEMGSGGGGGSSTFAGLSDVSLTSLTDGDFPQYDSATQKWKNVAITGVSVQPVIYSTEERVIGVWTDSKPLYQKTIEATISIPNNTWVSITLDSTYEIKVIVDAQLVQSGGSLVPVPWYRSSSIFDCHTFGGNEIQILQVGVVNVTGYRYAIQYTKTTDTPGSGTWTPSGVPAVHYSTDEQVVGTIQNTTLYEKLVTTGGNVPTGATLILRTALSNGYDIIQYTKSSS